MNKDININFEDIYNPMVDVNDIIITENQIRNEQIKKNEENEKNEKLLKEPLSTDTQEIFFCEGFCNCLFSICCCFCLFLSE